MGSGNWVFRGFFAAGRDRGIAELEWKMDIHMKWTYWPEGVHRSSGFAVAQAVTGKGKNTTQNNWQFDLR
eukprot:2513368-Amphidinium_carterae.3